MDPASANAVAVGIDGCRGGWVAAVCPPHGALSLHIARGLDDLLAIVPPNACVLVDMILGLPDADRPTRACDRLARRLLGRHASRVFPAPPREALSATGHAQACALARGATGRGISLQAFHLLPKIRELDGVDDPRLREGHPELAFARLNGGGPVNASKKTEAGRRARLALLAPHLPEAGETYATALRHIPRATAARDDPLDALALCVLARRPDQLRPLPGPVEPPETDRRGRPMRIWW